MNAFQLALALCKPCDSILLVHIALVTTGDANNYLTNSASSSSASASGSQQRDESEAKAALVVEKYRRLGYNVHVEKVPALSGKFWLNTSTLNKESSFHSKQTQANRVHLATSLLQCVLSMDPTFVVLGADDADLSYSLELLREKKMKEQFPKPADLMLETWNGGLDSMSLSADGGDSSLAGNAFLTATVDAEVEPSAEEIEEMEIDAAFERELMALSSVCSGDSVTNETLRKGIHEHPSLHSYRLKQQSSGGSVSSTSSKYSQKNSERRSFVEAVLDVGSNPSIPIVGNSFEKFSFILASPPPLPSAFENESAVLSVGDSNSLFH